jgi:hypothetical protein
MPYTKYSGKLLISHIMNPTNTVIQSLVNK